ncbi:tyrosine phosphatase family-domain-containing protein [Kockovaella imperatae]|uniref:diphosphoinositol-polyphosphate diphosphatase n=1 Tax=Kockovaella imperatae TaxID=4999 RepID=A0A1Y1UIF3_9TREE|nr:tyrosine phosphatase family-domain-containing protein [Kockovaella imperatae]ORX37769.1 tyrosine phosphatase family-domain-containing protein [Kockovaella imperatae]
MPVFLQRIHQTRPVSPVAAPAPRGITSPPLPIYLPPPALPNVEEDLIPPENFAIVAPGVYRSGFPMRKNFPFMETLRLKTILTLVLEEYPEANLKWCQDQDIQFMQFGIPGNKEPFDNIPEEVICAALVQILDKRNHPLLIHCNKGKHRTGCLVGCIRRIQSWSLTSIFDEYRRFSNPKSRAVDQQFIDLFQLSKVWEQVLSTEGGGLDNLPKWRMLHA